MTSKLPRVVITGRTNVGKSTLFNRLSSKVKSITLDQENVTRDFLHDTVCWQNACFDLVDTGGLVLKKSKDNIYQQVAQSVLVMLDKADIVVLVVDGSVGLLEEDRAIAKLLHRLDKQAILVINKGDVKVTQEYKHDFDRLGFQHTMVISAQHGHAVADLLDMIVENLPVKMSDIEGEQSLKVSIIGKPNVGKSSLLNALLKEERAIVSPEAGTTREPITEQVTFYRENINLTDTPGVRRKRGVTDQLEQLMVKSAFQALKNSDMVLLVTDASTGTIADQELKLAFYAFEHDKAVIVLLNKYDLIDEQTQRELDFNLEPYKYFFDKIQVARISCKTGKNVGKLLSIIKKVADRYKTRLKDDELTRVLKDALCKRQLFHQGKPLMIYNAKQVKAAPMTIVMFVNEPLWFGKSQLGYFERVLRKTYDLTGVPIKFITRK